ncbi:MAG: homoserine dehydrogenase [Candidatus Aminicenantes bacterium]|nr:homoserine dehydrogenase [Candidatus Aminicenantes bacterium]
MDYKIALIGCGNVGEGFLQILHEKASWLKSQHDFEAKIVAICDKLKGNLIVPEGLELGKLLHLLNQRQRIDDYDPAQKKRFVDPLDMIESVDANIICELTPTDIKTAEPATSYIRKALRCGKHVVTSNKGPAALYYHELIKLAKQNHVFFRVEGTVMSGTPVFSLFEYGLSGNTVNSLRGILNGTTNFILSAMEEKDLSYEEALVEAQKLGYAETDPTADVEGFDAMAKLMILSNVIFDHPLRIEDIERKGIVTIKREDIKEALSQNRRLKLIAEINNQDGQIKARVFPQSLPLTDPLARVMGANNALVFELDPLGQVFIQGPGAGKKETGYAILNDILYIHKNLINQKNQ